MDRTPDSQHNSESSNKLSPVPLLDVTRGNQPLRDEIVAAITSVVDSGRFIGGPNCQQFEQHVAEVCQTDHAIGCASGSDALLLSLMACEVGSGDEVIVPSFTFFATAGAVWRTGAVPVFVDIDPVTFNIAPHSVEAAITEKTKAIIPVHLFGQCAEMNAICEVAKRNSLFVIEDTAQAIGASYNGRPAGSLGSLGCFSFYPSKNLGGLGDGGMVTTSDAQLADKVRLLAAHGMRPRYHHHVVGFNSRLDAIQATALDIKLQQLPQWAQNRRANAARYVELFQAAGLAEQVKLPADAPDSGHVWNQFTIRVRDGNRDALRSHLADVGIGTEVYYPVPLHQQKCFRQVRIAGPSLPETDRASTEVLSLPIFPELTEEEQRTVVQQIGSFFSAQSSRQATPARRLAS